MACRLTGVGRVRRRWRRVEHGAPEARPNAGRVEQEICPQLWLPCKERPGGERTLGAIAGDTASDEVAIGSVTALDPGLNVVEGELCGGKDHATVNAAVLVPLEDPFSAATRAARPHRLHGSGTPLEASEVLSPGACLSAQIATTARRLPLRPTGRPQRESPLAGTPPASPRPRIRRPAPHSIGGAHGHRPVARPRGPAGRRAQ